MSGHTTLCGVAYVPIYGEDGKVLRVAYGYLRTSKRGTIRVVQSAFRPKHKGNEITYRSVENARRSWTSYVSGGSGMSGGWMVYPHELTFQGSPEGWDGP